MIIRIAGFAIGLTLGVATAGGAALLLYTQSGFLATAGFLLSVAIIAVAAGLWVGIAEGARGPRSTARRWVWIVTAFMAAGAMSLAWTVREDLRTSSIGGAIAVLLILAEPAYTTGTLTAALNARLATIRKGASSVAVPVLVGLGLGVILAATALIPNLEAHTLFFGSAALLAVVGNLEARRKVDPFKDIPGMDGLVVIVTGVSDAGQAGYVVAQRLLNAGAKVVITGSRPEVLERAQELAAYGECFGVQADLLQAGQANAVIDVARDRFHRLDGLVNVAGGLRVVKPISQTTQEEWHAEIRRNLDTALVMSQAALPMLREHGGAIVNFAAPAGFRAVAKLGAYSAGKAGVIALTRALALEEHANGVRVNAIAPGLIDTAQNRDEVGDPETTGWVTRGQIADVALFLLSPASTGVSGETVRVLGNSLK